MAIANLAMATGNIGRSGVGVNPLRGQNNVQGSCDMGSFPHEFSGYRHVADDGVRRMFEVDWNTPTPSNCCPCSSNSWARRSEEHTSELQSLMRISYAVFCLKKKNIQ